MSPENDQTRWIGIRPVNPAENIPVTPGAGAACTKVEPCAAGTQFKTLTKKLAPAISDIQAVELVVQYYDDYTTPGAAGYDRYSGLVPAGKIWVISACCLYHNDAANRTCWFAIESNATIHSMLNFDIALPTYTQLTAPGQFLMDEDQRMHFRFSAMAAAKHCYSTMLGWQISKYV